MTFPVGGLPKTETQEDLKHRTRPSRSVAFTHGGSDMDLTDPANGLDTKCATELWAIGTGNIEAQLVGDSGAQTYPVVAGTVIYGLFVKILGASTADCIARV